MRELKMPSHMSDIMFYRSFYNLYTKSKVEEYRDQFITKLMGIDKKDVIARFFAVK